MHSGVVGIIATTEPHKSPIKIWQWLEKNEYQVHWKWVAVQKEPISNRLPKAHGVGGNTYYEVIVFSLKKAAIKTYNSRFADKDEKLRCV